MVLEFDSIQQAKDYYAANPDSFQEVCKGIWRSRKAGLNAKISHRDVLTFFWPMDKPKIERGLSEFGTGQLLSQQGMAFDGWLKATAIQIKQDAETASEILALAEGYGVKDPRVMSLKHYLAARVGVGDQTRKAICEDNKLYEDWQFKFRRENEKFGWAW
jgi:hypothetical protein